MKLFNLAILFSFMLYGCSVLKHGPGEAKKKPGSHIIIQNKDSVKENMKFQKEQAKTAKKKREELEMYERETHPEKFIKKKKRR
jgi:hypothetical protein